MTQDLIVNIGSGNESVLPGIKLLPELMLTQICAATWHYLATIYWWTDNQLNYQGAQEQIFCIIHSMFSPVNSLWPRDTKYHLRFPVLIQVMVYCLMSPNHLNQGWSIKPKGTHLSELWIWMTTFFSNTMHLRTPSAISMVPDVDIYVRPKFFMVVSADALAPNGARASPGTEMTTKYDMYSHTITMTS